VIGISFYLNDPLAEKRIAKAAENGVKRAFTSLHIPEESGDLAQRAGKLLEFAKAHGIEVFADVSARTPAHLGLNNLADLESLGVVGLRLDDFFDHETIVGLAERYKIALNASILFEDDITALLERGLRAEQLIAWHNYYPRCETGLDERFFTRQNEMFAQFGIPVSAYICGDGEKRGPLFEGLPTLEKHRNVEPFTAAVELFRSGVTDVYVGDPEVSDNFFGKIKNYKLNHTVTVRIEGFTEGEFQLRPDFARDVLRLMDTRSSTSVAPMAPVERPKGSITLDNDLYGRYRGEVQITLVDLPPDPRVNVTGRVVAADLPLLSLLDPGNKIMLIYNK
jgi:uncharacterized protein